MTDWHLPPREPPTWDLSYTRGNDKHFPKGPKGGQFAPGLADGILCSTKVGEVATRMRSTSMAWRDLAGLDSSGAPSDAEMDANWAKQIRGRVSKDKVARGLVHDAITENNGNQLWREIVGKHVEDHVIVSTPYEQGGRITMLDASEETNAHRLPGTTAISENGVMAAASGAPHKSPPAKAAASSGYGLAALLRHEYGHSIDHFLQERHPAARQAIIDSIGDKHDLSYYAYWHAANGNNGEVIPELLALVTHPNYREGDFPKIADAGRQLLDALGVGV